MQTPPDLQNTAFGLAATRFAPVAGSGFPADSPSTAGNLRLANTGANKVLKFNSSYVRRRKQPSPRGATGVASYRTRRRRGRYSFANFMAFLPRVLRMSGVLLSWLI